jgi:hypothetical protein
MMHSSAPGELACFQDAFTHALLAPEATPSAPVAELVAQPAFAVYRNTVMKACIDALQANYSTVTRIVGEQWFRAAAAVYVREAQPADPTLLRYGAEFAEFLARFEPAAGLPYLHGVARLDRCWTEAHGAPNQPALEPVTIARLAPKELARTVLHPHPAARWAWFADAPIYTIWSRNRGGGDGGADLDWQPEGALLTRPHDAVVWSALAAAGCAFLDTCAAGSTLDRATQAALEAQPGADLAGLMFHLLKCGAFARIDFAHDGHSGLETP